MPPKCIAAVENVVGGNALEVLGKVLRGREVKRVDEGVVGW